MRLEVNAKGLTQAEIQTAIDNAITYKGKTIVQLEETLEETRKEIRQLLVQSDSEFAAEMLNIIKEHYPDLLKVV